MTKRQYSNNQWLIRQERAAKITGFWHTIEFLNQSTFPAESRANQKLIKKEEEILLLAEDTKPSSSLSMYHKLDCTSILNDLIKADDSKFVRHPEKGRECWICIGMLERRELVKKLDELLNIQEEEIEKDPGVLACFGLKTDSSGYYIENSFNISPLLWGIGIIARYGADAQMEITTARYLNDLEKYENILQKDKIITNELLDHTLQELNHDYIIPLIKKACTYEGLLIYNRYINQKVLEKSDGKTEDYSDLSHGYFTKDLMMVTDAILDNRFGSCSEIQENVIDYIISPWGTDCNDRTSVKSESRIDIKNDRAEITKWLMPERLPLGKWPSKYVPSLMQQVAINLQVSQDPSINPVFSVNGPPGTGKTTLLKEIISHNLVERARLLVEYDTPDDAFLECFYSDGKKDHNGYDKYYYRYFKLKNEAISNYGMLVASCNNDAVENITKELPNGLDLVKALKSDNNSDSEQLKCGLSEIENLFHLQNVKQRETYKVKRKINDKTYVTESADLPDIYFSWLAHRLITGDEAMEKEFTEWGMISAPLGKRSNIIQYYYHVLNPLIDEFLIPNDKRSDRLATYRESAAVFKEQLEIVKRQQTELTEFSRLNKTFETEIRKHEISAEQQNLLINEKRNAIQEAKNRKNVTEASLYEAENELCSIERQLSASNQERQRLIAGLEECRQSRTALSDRIIELENSYKLFDHIYNIIGKETEKIRRHKEFTIKKSDLTARESCIIEELSKNSDICSQLIGKQQYYINCIQNMKEVISSLTQDIKEQESFLMVCQKKVESIDQSILSLKLKLVERMNEARKQVDVLDSSFWEDFYSKEEKASTRAQLINPWITEEFNRSREKLFYLALQVHKEFILSSTACRDNFINLSMMWRVRNNTEGDLVNYSRSDREKVFPELLNTLFLFTPVISTTFASVQTFLADIKEPGKIGLLIIDEAGQAAPHMAAGALFRSKKAIIVGDPRQVEPVVTNDADHIKTVFSNENLKPYISKHISVQEFADRINKYGTYLKGLNENDSGTWVGCPLIVHRRCINPMFRISNHISYGDSMKLKTAPPKPELANKFLYDKAEWLDVPGTEKDTQGKNHYVEKQGEKVCEMIAESFRKYSGPPDLFVISPFKSVISGIVKQLETCTELSEYGDALEDWCLDNCGTVHKFQGKEAAEVIFILGCDRNSLGAVRWVNSNIVNVAVTRAKYRIYVIGDSEVWRHSKYVEILREGLF